MKTWCTFLAVLALASWAHGQQLFQNGINVNNQYVKNVGLVDVGAHYTNSGVRSLSVSLGQIAGVSPTNGAPLEQAALLPMKPRAMDMAGTGNRLYAISAAQITGDGSVAVGFVGSDIVLGVADGMVGTDLLDVASVDARYTRRAGDTMTGALQLPANGLSLSGQQLVAGGGRIGVGTNQPAEMLHVAGNARVEQDVLILGNVQVLGNATLLHVLPQGDLSMGSYTNQP